ncbi:MAG: Smr/MutS family protein [Saprospiraceae bacterium]|nr:Smr/MutS family protein [Saprospiraceae bacterium]
MIENEMDFYPANIKIDLEFDKIEELVFNYCLSDWTKEISFPLPIFIDKNEIERSLAEVDEAKISFAKGDSLPLLSFENIDDILRVLNIEDYVLGIEQILQLRSQLKIVQQLISYFNPDRQLVYPNLFKHIQSIIYNDGLVRTMDAIINPLGEIRSDASLALITIRKVINGKLGEIDREFKKILTNLRQLGVLTDSGESIRNGRKVVTVFAEHKRQIPGIIHDESATGKTVYIEPNAMISLHNEYFEALQEEKREIYKILKLLCQQLRPYVEHFHMYGQLLLRLDLILAKGKFGLDIQGEMPNILDQPHIDIRQGIHPLLLLKFRGKKQKVEPFDMRLDKYKILLISGPNAGGKSITLKSVGLLQMMVQAGLLVPVKPYSEFGIFHQFFSDIGDHQSLEEDLSTYSSHLKAMHYFIHNADERTLILLDEFGTGTEPKVGGAIAEGVLKMLIHLDAFAVITTHYANLKLFAYHSQSMINGAMDFDKETLSPTYRLRIGKPGSSYAFEIAQKVGLPSAIIDYARHRIGANEHAVDELLVDLQREKQEIEEKLNEISEKQKLLDRLIKNYESAHYDFEIKRKKLKLEAKELAISKTDAEEKAVESILKSIRKEKNEAMVHQKMVELKAKKIALLKETDSIIEDVHNTEKSSNVLNKPVEQGDFVRIRATGATGEVDSVQKDTAIVIVGQMRMRFKLRDIIPISEPVAVQSFKSVHFDRIDASAKSEIKIDIRGMRKEEAIFALQTFFDKALMADHHELSVLHGKGDGVLRLIVKEVARQYDGAKVRHPEEDQGGQGISLVIL